MSARLGTNLVQEEQPAFCRRVVDGRVAEVFEKTLLGLYPRLILASDDNRPGLGARLGHFVLAQQLRVKVVRPLFGLAFPARFSLSHLCPLFFAALLSSPQRRP